jgi:hypothetical protein
MEAFAEIFRAQRKQVFLGTSDKAISGLVSKFFFGRGISPRLPAGLLGTMTAL